MYQEDPQPKRMVSPPPHYYGDIVRALMILGGVTMMVSYPFFVDRIPGPIFSSILVMLALAVVGGLMNPRQRWVMLAGTTLSGASFLVFEYYAIIASRQFGRSDSFFVVNQLLALLFFIALYYATKTVRAMYLKK